MSIQTFFKSLTSTATHRRPIRRRLPASRLCLEQLEDRTLPSNFTAATVSDLIADINAANQQGGPNTITLVAPTGSTYTLTAVDNTTDGATGLPVIAANNNLTIIGSGDSIQRSTAAGTPAFRLLDVASGAALTLQDLTLQGGWAFGSGVSASGGAIFSQGSLTLDGVTVQGNTAVGSDGNSGGSGSIYAGAGSDGRGGGLYMAGGAVTITSSNLPANQALGGNGGGGSAVGYLGFDGGNGGNGLGGAVYVAAGTVIMTSNTWSANTAQGGRGGGGGVGVADEFSLDSYGGAGGYGGSGCGGAVYVAAGTVSMTSETLSANTAQGARGGDGGATVNTNSSYPGGHGGNAGNGGFGLGGGVDAAGGTVTLKSATVSSNSALAGTGGLGGFGDVSSGQNGNPGLGEGGGLYIAPLAAVGLDAFTLQHVLNNTASTSYPDIFGLGISFAISGYPSPVTAGSANGFTVTAEDAFGNPVTAYTGTVHFTSSALKSVLPANYTFTGADAGVHTFSAILRSAGTQSITVNDTANSGIFGSQTGIVVNPAATNHLVVSQFPTKTTAGVAQNFCITTQDPFGNTTPGFADTVSFSSSDPQAVLPANYTFTSGDAGIHIFSATLKTAGTQSITVQDMTNPNVLSGTRAGIIVNPAAASTLQVSGFPSSVTAGTAYNFTVTAFDPYGNIATGSRGTVTFTSSDGTASLPANYPFTSSDAGVHTFSATLNSPGTQSITATDTVNANITGTESGITVVSVQPTAGISGPSIGVPGQPLTYTLTASESGLSASTAYSYSVLWGDGSPVQGLSGTSGTQVGHVFTTPGNDAISVIATDPNSHASTPASTSVSVTTVAMETDPSNSSLTALYVGGTLGNDTIAITPVANGGVMVGMNFVNYGSFFPTGHVVVYSQSGNDIIKTAAQTINGVLTFVNVPLMIFAGNGNDILNVTGSSANNVLVGGGGTDRLLGGQGRDILIGGAGQATLEAGTGDTILIGGTTAYDNNAAALAAILAEWSSSDDYATRFARLTGSVSGGLNGNFLLNANTVHGNGQADNLYGGQGMDWFFAGMMDALFNKTTAEAVTPI